MAQLFKHEENILVGLGWVPVPTEGTPDSILFVHARHKFFIMFILHKLTDNWGDEDYDVNFELCFGYPQYRRLPGRIESCEIKTAKTKMNILNVTGPKIKDIVEDAIKRWPNIIEFN